MEQEIKDKRLVVEGEPEIVTDIREQILTAFGDLVFVEDGHHYYLNGAEIPSVSAVVHRFSHPFDEKKKEKARILFEKGLVNIDESGFSLTKNGFLLSNSIICEFI